MYAQRFELVCNNAEQNLLTMSTAHGFSGLLIDSDDVSDYARALALVMRPDLLVPSTDLAAIILTVWCAAEAVRVEPSGVDADGALRESVRLGDHEMLCTPVGVYTGRTPGGHTGGVFMDVFVGELVIRPRVGSMI